MLREKSKGITLVALVITIVILLILAGISISTLTNTGIFQKAKDAKGASENAEKKQNEILAEYEKEMEQYGDNTLVSNFNSGKVKIGDYVSYKPDKASTDKILEELGVYSGTTANTTETLLQELDLKWRILDIKDGKVRLISAEPTTSKITLYGYNGYNNAVKLIDDTCSTLYNNSGLVNKIQNLKIEDIQDKMKEKEYSNVDSNYGQRFKPSNKLYPSILPKENEQNVKIGENTIVGNQLDLSEQEYLINQTENERLQADVLDIKYTLWKKAMVETDFNNDKYYELFINNGENYDTYWMSSRCIHVNDTNAGFDVRNVSLGDVDADRLYHTSVGGGSSACAFRPVITLNSSVRLDKEKQGEGTLNIPFNIK